MFKRILIITSVLILWPSISAFDDWIEPNAWERHSPSKPSDSCPVCECGAQNALANEETSLKLYKGVIDKLFNKDYFLKNTGTGKFERAFRLSLTPAQFRALENTSDLPSINTIVMIALQRAEEYEYVSSGKGFDFWTVVSVVEWIFEITKNLILALLQICFHEKARFLMFIIGVVMLILFIRKHYNKNIIIASLLTFALIGYFMTYIECNTKLKEESKHLEEPRSTNFLLMHLNRFLGWTAKEKREDVKLKLPFCRPDKVLLMYFNGLFFNQLNAIVANLAEGMNVIADTVPFPYNYIGMVALPFLFWGLILLMFKYIFNPAQWGRFYHSSRTEQNNQQNANNNTQGQDCLSGENLKNLIEIMKNNIPNGAANTNHSSVEDVKDLPKITLNLNESFDGDEETNKFSESLNDEVRNIKKDADVKLKSGSEKCDVEQTLRKRKVC